MTAVTKLAFILLIPFITGINSYAAFIILFVGVLEGWLVLGSLAAFSPLIFLFMIILFFIEFIADKKPWVDVIWDLFHIPLRPLLAVLIMHMVFAQYPLKFRLPVLVVAAMLALVAVVTKLAIRCSINLNPHYLKNWAASVAEIGFVVGNIVVFSRAPLASIALSCLWFLLAFFIIEYRGRDIRKMTHNLKTLFSPDVIVKIKSPSPPA